MYNKNAYYLTGDLSSIKYWWGWKISNIIRHGVNIYRIKFLMSLQEPLPKRSQGQWSLGQEHESNFANSLEWILLHMGNERSPPEELGVVHGVQKTRWRSDPSFYTGWLFKTRSNYGLSNRCHIWASKILNSVQTSKWYTKDEKQKQKEELKKPKRKGFNWVVCSSASGNGSGSCRGLAFLNPHHSGLHLYPNFQPDSLPDISHPRKWNLQHIVNNQNSISQTEPVK